jgi:hypothetical protein
MAQKVNRQEKGRRSSVEDPQAMTGDHPSCSRAKQAGIRQENSTSGENQTTAPARKNVAPFPPLAENGNGPAHEIDELPGDG